MQSLTDVCTQDLGNLGYEACAVMPERFEGFMLAPQSYALTAANLADDTTLIGILQTASLAAKTARVVPFLNGVDDCVDNTAASTPEMSGYGNFRGVTIGKPMYAFTLKNKGIHLLQQFFKYNGNKGISIAMVDKANSIFMRKSGTGAKFMPCQITTEPIKAATGSAEAIMVVNVYLNEEDAFLNQEKLYSYPTASTTILGDVLHGIHDVELKAVSQAATTATVKAILPANFTNMSTLYGTELAAAGAWDVTNKATGAAVTPSGVTVSAGNFMIAGLTTATTYYISLSTPSALFALGSPVGSKTTGGFESNVIEVLTA